MWNIVSNLCIEKVGGFDRESSELYITCPIEVFLEDVLVD
jgi:hypothetical protein